MDRNFIMASFNFVLQGSQSNPQQSVRAKVEGQGQGSRRLTQPTPDDNLGSPCSIC